MSVSVIEAAVSADREELHVEAGGIAVDGGAFGTGHGVGWGGGALVAAGWGEWGCGCC